MSLKRNRMVSSPTPHAHSRSPIERMYRRANGFAGWWRATRLDQSATGWTPAAYLEEVRTVAPPPPPPAPATNGAATAAAAANRAKPTPPAPPAKRPAGRKPAPQPTAPRDSGYSNGNTPSGSGAATPQGQSSGGPSIAGGLAEALRARQKAMHSEDADGSW